jgi:hypothetical protein
MPRDPAQRRARIHTNRARVFSLLASWSALLSSSARRDHMVHIHIFGLECGTSGDAVILRAECVYKGGAGSKADDIVRDWKPDAKAAAAAKVAVGGTKMWKTAFKTTVHMASVSSLTPVYFLQQQAAVMAVLEKHGIAGSLRTSWSADADASAAWAGVKIKADPTGTILKKVVEELRACKPVAVKGDDRVDDDEE